MLAKLVRSILQTRREQSSSWECGEYRMPTDCGRWRQKAKTQTRKAANTAAAKATQLTEIFPTGCKQQHQKVRTTVGRAWRQQQLAATTGKSDSYPPNQLVVFSSNATRTFVRSEKKNKRWMKTSTTTKATAASRQTKQTKDGRMRTLGKLKQQQGVSGQVASTADSL